jgi:tetratricopeptide (TPR) repeat protein
MRCIKGWLACVTLAAFLLATAPFFPMGSAEAADPKPSVDKEKAAEMVRFGIQSYQRSKYLDAKEYFRKAIQADPGSAVAWRYYDLAVIYALAEKVNKNMGLIAPDVSPQGPADEAAAPPPPEKPAPAKKPKFIIMEDEGC